MAKGPDAFRTISEAADELGIPQHVLRFWETKFTFIRPMKRAGGRRFYRPHDIAVLGGVLDQAKQGQRIDVTDPKITTASNAVDAWVHDSCGFQALDLTSTGEVSESALPDLKAPQRG